MKNKFLALAAFGTAALGSTIVAAPAHAAIPQGQGPDANITVNVTVPEVLYLRTASEVNLEITNADLTGTTLTPLGGSTPPALLGPDADAIGSPTVNTASPFAGGFADGVPVQKTLTSAYIVWSNSPTGNYQVQVTPGTFTGPLGETITVAVTDPNPITHTAEGLVTALPKNINLTLAANSDTVPGGTYTGTINVEAFRP